MKIARLRARVFFFKAALGVQHLGCGEHAQPDHRTPAVVFPWYPPYWLDVSARATAKCQSQLPTAPSGVPNWQLATEHWRVA